MAITIETIKALMPFARIGFTYTSEWTKNKSVLVNGSDGTNRRVAHPDGISKVSHFVIGMGTELHYTDMVRSAARAQNVSDRSLAESFIGKPLNGCVWVEGYEGCLLRAIKTGEIQLRGYAIDDDGIIKSSHSEYYDNATGKKLDYVADLEKFVSKSPSATKAREIKYLTIDGVELLSVDGTRIVAPAVKNFALSGISNLVVNP